MKRGEIQDVIDRKISDPYGRGYSMRPVLNEGTNEEKGFDSMRTFRQTVEEGDTATVRVYKRTGSGRELIETVEFKVEPPGQKSMLEQMLDGEMAEVIGGLLDLYPRNPYGIRYEPLTPDKFPEGIVVVPNLKKTMDKPSHDDFVLTVFLDGKKKSEVEKQERKWEIAAASETRSSVVTAVYFAASLERSDSE